ncbi:hypothetical protein V6L77_12335 [Pannonibacter sp. Pt2-lr]
MRTIHDFGGFPRALFEIQYPASAPEDVTGEVMEKLSAAGIEAEIDPTWGLDHGAWVPPLSPIRRRIFRSSPSPCR